MDLREAEDEVRLFQSLLYAVVDLVEKRTVKGDCEMCQAREEAQVRLRCGTVEARDPDVEVGDVLIER